MGSDGGLLQPKRAGGGDFDAGFAGDVEGGQEARFDQQPDADVVFAFVDVTGGCISPRLSLRSSAGLRRVAADRL
jgi:hypothetical protein